ncbi:MAG: hypothetical protein FWE21_07250 [Defluviitaleaceae bacterium]|nr:hypothetical protein [Defluviitaleaceae bacterium]
MKNYFTPELEELILEAEKPEALCEAMEVYFTHYGYNSGVEKFNTHSVIFQLIKETSSNIETLSLRAIGE